MSGSCPTLTQQTLANEARISTSFTSIVAAIVFPTPPIPTAIVWFAFCRFAGGAVTVTALEPPELRSTPSFSILMRSGRSTTFSGSVGTSGGSTANAVLVTCAC